MGIFATAMSIVGACLATVLWRHARLPTERPVLTPRTELATHSYHRSHSLSPGRFPDTASTIYPDRAIRPLPRSRLRAKLSPEQVSSLVFPPSPPPISPTLSFGAQETGTPAQQPRLTNGDVHHHHHHHHEHDHEHDEHDHDEHHHHHHHHTVHHDHCTCGHDGDSGDDEVEFDHPDYRYATAPMANGSGLKPESLQRRLVEASRAANKPPPPGSTASSGDGYESFENTSNKKKRKIPLSSASSMHQSQLSAEMANMGISNSHHEQDEIVDNGVQHTKQVHYDYDSHAAPSGTGISGAGRGRYGRQDGRNRRPLGSSTLNTVNGYNSRSSPRGSDARNGEGKFRLIDIHISLRDSQTADVTSKTHRPRHRKHRRDHLPGHQNCSRTRPVDTSSQGSTERELASIYYQHRSHQLISARLTVHVHMRIRLRYEDGRPARSIYRRYAYTKQIDATAHTRHTNVATATRTASSRQRQSPSSTARKPCPIKSSSAAASPSAQAQTSSKPNEGICNASSATEEESTISELSSPAKAR